MATVPVAVLHASSVQTDLLTAFWVLCVVALVVEAWQREGSASDWRHALCLAAASALAVATKATAVLAVSPWLVLYAAAVVRRDGIKRLGYAARAGYRRRPDAQRPGHAQKLRTLRPAGGSGLGRSCHPAPAVHTQRRARQCLCKFALHAGTPWENLNANIARGVLWLTRAVFRADPAAQFPDYGGFHVVGFSTHESGAGLPVVVGGALLAAAALLLRRNAELRSRMLPFLIAGGLAFLLHAALVRWQPFGARLQLASLIWVPFVLPWVFAHRRAQAWLAGVAVALALPALLLGMPRPLLGTQSVLTTNRSEQLAIERPDYFEVVEFTVLMAGLSNCSSLGILTSYDFPEYYLTALARREGLPLRWRYVGEVGESTKLGPGSGTEGLCMVLVAEQIVGAEPTGLRERFRVVWADPPFEVLEYLGEPGG
jgi:hypothetical protein